MNTRTLTALEYPKRTLRSSSNRLAPPPHVCPLKPSPLSHLPSRSTLSAQPPPPNLVAPAQRPNSIDQLEYADEDEGEDEDTIMEEGSEEGSGNTDPELGAAAAFREPSPALEMLFEPRESAYAVMSPARLTQVTQSMSRLALAVLGVLGHYRQQLNQWEAVPKPSDQVMHASTLIDQCLLRLAVLLEPVEQKIAMVLFGFMRALKALDEDIICNRLCTRNEVECTEFWSRLAQLADQVGQAEDRLADLVNQLSEVYDWIDGCLTPVLGRLAVDEDDEANRAQKRNPAVSYLLDVQSYFCQTVDQLSWATKVYRKLITHMRECLEEFGDAMVKDDGFVDQLLEWVRLSGTGLRPVAESLIVLSSVANGIQTLTTGTPHELVIRPR